MDLPENFDFASAKSTWPPLSYISDSPIDGSENTELNVGTKPSTWG